MAGECMPGELRRHRPDAGPMTVDAWEAANRAASRMPSRCARAAYAGPAPRSAPDLDISEVTIKASCPMLRLAHIGGRLVVVTTSTVDVLITHAISPRASACRQAFRACVRTCCPEAARKGPDRRVPRILMLIGRQ
ncbi:hypothetical protein GCM10010515_57560 [Streptomyces fructofermentans]|uniref:Uncharacterized protein n=1 Tax=Streptomyces fructofermentans TaxID=152141 RepID=A0A918NN66_9ACTN|nr:hypothetical protein GCM10010515_57560 [Streptomyces fructofermentans]